MFADVALRSSYSSQSSPSSIVARTTLDFALTLGSGLFKFNGAGSKEGDCRILVDAVDALTLELAAGERGERDLIVGCD